MKKVLISLLLAMVLAFTCALAACGENDNKPEPSTSTVEPTQSAGETSQSNEETSQSTQEPEEPGETVWSVIGDMGEEDWDVDHEMALQEDGTFKTAEPITFVVGDEFKVRADADWKVAYPAENWVISEEIGDCTAFVIFNPETKEITLEKLGGDGPGGKGEPEEKEESVWSVVGSFGGEDKWEEDIAMYVQEDGTVKTDDLELAVGDAFKVRKDGAWDEAYPAENWLVTEEVGAGTYAISFNPETHEIELIAGFNPGGSKGGDEKEASVWSVVGKIGGEEKWDEDLPMYEEEDGTFKSDAIEFAVGDAFKVRKDGAWDEAYPEQNWVISEEVGAGKYYVIFNAETKEITLKATSSGGMGPQEGYVAPPAGATLTVYGNIDGVAWEECETQGKEQTLTLQDDGTYATGPITFTAGEQIQIRANGNWDDWVYPVERYTITAEDAGTQNRQLIFNPETGEIRFQDFGGFSK